MRHKLPSFGLRQFIKFTTLGLKSMASNLFKTYSSKAGIHTLNRFTYFWPPSWRMPPMSHPFWQHVLSHPRGSITQIHFKAHLFWNVKKKSAYWTWKMVSPALGPMPSLRDQSGLFLPAESAQQGGGRGPWVQSWLRLIPVSSPEGSIACR